MHFGSVPLIDLCGIYKSLGTKLFDRNIRAALPADNPPNKKIREMLGRILVKDVEEPSVFAFRHNGVTLAADRIDLGVGKATLHTPRLGTERNRYQVLARFLEE